MRAIVRAYADAFRGLPGDVWRLAAVFFVNRAGTMVLPFLSLYVSQRLGHGKHVAAIAMFAFGLGSLAGSFAGGRMAVRFGAVRVCEASLAGAGVAFLALVPLRTPATLIPCVFVASVVSEAFRPACLTVLADLAPKDVRVRAFGLIRLAANAGMAIGPAAGGLLAEVGYAWLFVGEAATCWLAAILLLTSLHRRARAREREPAAPDDSDRRALSDGPFVLVCAALFAYFVVLFQAFTTLPVYLAEAYAFSERNIGWIFGWNGLLITAFEMLVVRRFEKHDAMHMLALGAVLTGLGFAVLPWGIGLPFAAVSVAVWSFGEMFALPFANVVPMQRAGRRRTGEYMGLLTSTISAAFIVAGPLGFAVYAGLGGEVLWSAAGVVGLAVAAGALALAPKIRERPPAENDGAASSGEDDTSRGADATPE